MVVNTLRRDYNIARILADHEQRISFLERQILNLQTLIQLATPFQFPQGSDQNVISSIVPVNSAIVVPINGLSKIDLELRYQTGTAGGGIRWQWAATGTVALVARSIGAAGAATAGSTTTTQDMYWRNWFTMSGLVQIAQFNNSSTNRGAETLIVDGVGTLTLQFAQNASVAVNTTLFADSYALLTRISA
jgi:hypothetical protein